MHRHMKTGLQENLPLAPPVTGVPVAGVSVAGVLVGFVVKVSALKKCDPKYFTHLIFTSCLCKIKSQELMQ